MATQPPPATDAPRPASSAFRILGIILLLAVLVCGGCVTYLFLNISSLAGRGLEGFMDQMLAQVDLPQAQEARIQTDVHTVTTALRNKEITVGQLDDFLEKLIATDIGTLLVLEAVESEYATKVKPDPARLEEVQRDFMRFKRGIVEGAIPEEQVSDMIDRVATRSGPQILIEEDLTARELTGMVEAMEKVVDGANIPAEPITLDYAGLVHDVLAESFPELAADADAAWRERQAGEAMATQTAPAEVADDTLPADQ